jgi:hypothetical protein
MVAAMSEPAKTAPNTETTLYVALVTLAGIALVVVRAPALRFDNGLLFAVLVFGSIVLSTWKVPLPLIPGGATLSMSYFTDFVALLLLGPDEGMLVAAASGGAQSLLLSKGRPHLTRALFNASVLMIAAQLAWHASSPLGGFFSDSKLELLQATVAAAAVFFFVNTVLVAVAVALSRREPIVKTWYDHTSGPPWSPPVRYTSRCGPTVSTWAVLPNSSATSRKSRHSISRASRRWPAPSMPAIRQSITSGVVRTTSAAYRAGPWRWQRPPE